MKIILHFGAAFLMIVVLLIALLAVNIINLVVIMFEDKKQKPEEAYITETHSYAGYEYCFPN